MDLSELFDFSASYIQALGSPLLNKSEVFCMSPWIQLHAQTNGKVAPCCMASVYDGNEVGNLRENANLKEAWNSENMKQLRKNMLEGKKSTICTHCYDYEKLGKFSERMSYNKYYKQYFSRVRATGRDGSLHDVTIPVIDLRFSNKCNYKCRICDSAYSSLWYEEEQRINKPTFGDAREMKMVHNQDEFWKSYEDILKGVKRLHFAGGEPLFMDEHYRTLDYLIETGNTDVVLSYNTNFSTLRYKKYDVVDMWAKFKRVEVWASLDAMGPQGDYQRKGQRWDKIEENIKTVQQKCSNVMFGVNVTVSALNVLHVPDFYKYMVNNKFVKPNRMNLYLLFDPPYFNLTNLTPALKERARKLYREFEEGYLRKLSNTGQVKSHVQAVLAFMDSEEGTRRSEFRHWIKAVDELREEKFLDVFPELQGMMLE